MENGFYVCKELRVEVCERGEDVIVRVTNDTDPDGTFYLFGESARALVMTLLDQLDK